MKKKRIGIGVGILICTIFLGGCSNQIPGMTPEQEQAIGEYAAGLVVKYDKYHGSRLVDLSEEEMPAASQESSEEPPAKEPPSETIPVEDTPTAAVGEEAGGIKNTFSPEQILGLPEGITLTYQGERVAPSYPEGESEESLFPIDASQGKQLLILSFLLNNGTGENHSLSLFTGSPVFKVAVNGGYGRNVLTTMLADDLSTFIGDLSAGESKELVLLLEVDETAASNLTSITMEVKNVSDSTTISLK